MGKRTHQTSDHSGSKFYKYEGGVVELLPTFVYEVSLYKYWKNGFCQLGQKLYKADKLLHIKDNCIVTQYEGYSIEKEITLVGIPQEFVDEMGLSLYDSKPKKKKSKKK